MYYMSHKAEAVNVLCCAGALPLVNVYKPCTCYQCGVKDHNLAYLSFWSGRIHLASISGSSAKCSVIRSEASQDCSSTILATACHVFQCRERKALLGGPDGAFTGGMLSR